MAGGEVAWKQARGPKRAITAKVPLPTYTLLEVAARSMGVGVTGLSGRLLERWALMWLEENADEITEEKERRKEHA